MQLTIKKRKSDTPPIVEAETSPAISDSRMSEMAVILATGIVRLKSRIGTPSLCDGSPMPSCDDAHTDRSQP